MLKKDRDQGEEVRVKELRQIIENIDLYSTSDLIDLRRAITITVNGRRDPAKTRVRLHFVPL